VAERKSIWIVDPGLMEAGGHHAAFAETLCQGIDKSYVGDVRVYAHRLLDQGIKLQLTNAGINTHTVFNTRFYQHFNDGAVLGPAGIQKYIRLLAIEFTQVITDALSEVIKNKIILFFPCLNWEHALALQLAITKCQLVDSSGLRIVTCAMYSPSVPTGRYNVKTLWYQIAFKRLNRFTFVLLYISDFELCAIYRELLADDTLDTHPCYLIDWERAKHQKLSKNSINQQQILLYIGDAKKDKGFNRLPEVLERGLANTPDTTTFIIQFTLEWEYPEIQQVVVQLKEIAQKEPRLILHHGFWSNCEVIAIISAIDMAVCTYDTRVYQYKSSGMLWVLAFFRKPLLISKPCWLSREAERLGLAVYCDEKLDIANIIGNFYNADLPATRYASHLYSPMLPWLNAH
jgi:hypothetical protein